MLFVIVRGTDVNLVTDRATSNLSVKIASNETIDERVCTLISRSPAYISIFEVAHIYILGVKMAPTCCPDSDFAFSGLCIRRCQTV